MIRPATSAVLPDLLEQTQLSLREGSETASRIEPGRLVRRADHLAERVAALLASPAAVASLRRALEPARSSCAGSLNSWLPLVLDGVLDLSGADRADLQIFDPTTAELRLVAASGFDDNFVDRFALVKDDRTACGRAALHSNQVYIRDIALDELFAPHCHAAAKAGFTAVQSTPLHDASGRLVGIMSTHWEDPRIVCPGDLRLLDLHGALIGARLGQLLGGGHADASDTDTPTAPHACPGPVARAFPDNAFSPLMDDILETTWSTGWALARASASPELRAGAAQLEPATARVEETVRLIRSFVVNQEDAEVAASSAAGASTLSDGDHA